MFKFELGQKVKERITGFKGVIVARSQYMTGCNRYGVQSQKLKHDGKPLEWEYFDEDLLEIDGKNINIKIQQHGGPVRMEAPER